jgi:LysR family transcriptional regulator, transcriptional activator of nhaA
MNVWINYHHLYYFMTIAECEGISRAAEKLRLGQPTLSAQLKQFEEHLGVQLFERKHKKLILTEHGKLALEYARTIFRTGNEMYEALNDRLQPTKVKLQIGSLDSIPKQVILQLSRAAFKTSPCTISLVEGKYEELISDLISHKIDLVVSNFLPRESDKRLFHRVISNKAVGIYGSPKFKGLREGFPHSLEGQPFIMSSYDSQMRYDIDNWLNSLNLKVDVICETQDIALKKLFAVNELAIMPAASHTVQRQILSGELVEIGTIDSVREELFLIAADRKIENPVASSIMRNFNL